MKLSNQTISLTLLMALLTPDVAGYTRAAAAADYEVQQILRVGGEGGFDYVTLDDSGKTLYLPRTTHTQVVDARTGTVLADIPKNSRSHGVALVPELGRGFISNGGDATVQVFDLKSNLSLGRVQAAKDADCIIYDSASKCVLAFCGDAHVMIAIPADVDPKDGQASASVDLGGKPEFAVADGRGKVFVNLVDKNAVAVIDTSAMKVTAKWPITVATQPVGDVDGPSGKAIVCRVPQPKNGDHECGGWPCSDGPADRCRRRCDRIPSRNGICELWGRHVERHSRNDTRKIQCRANRDDGPWQRPWQSMERLAIFIYRLRMDEEERKYRVLSKCWSWQKRGSTFLSSRALFPVVRLRLFQQCVVARCASDETLGCLRESEW